MKQRIPLVKKGARVVMATGIALWLGTGSVFADTPNPGPAPSGTIHIDARYLIIDGPVGGTIPPRSYTTTTWHFSWSGGQCCGEHLTAHFDDFTAGHQGQSFKAATWDCAINCDSGGFTRDVYTPAFRGDSWQVTLFDQNNNTSRPYAYVS